MKTIIFKNGNSANVTGEAGKYWLCGEIRVRKLSKSIAEVREVPNPEENFDGDAENKATAEKPKKRTARKKKTGEATNGDSGK